jgi:hypothetical protein
VHHHTPLFSRRSALAGLGIAAFCVALLALRDRSTSTASVPAVPAFAPIGFAQTASRKSDVKKSSVSAIELASASCEFAPEVAELDRGQSAQLSRAIELNMMADRAGISLSPDQLTRLTEITSYFQEVRNVYEASIAKLHSQLSGRRALLQIPVYPTAGDNMRELYYAEIARDLGAAAAKQVRAKLGSQLENLFAGFGASEQTLELADASANGRELVLTRSAVFWNDATAQGLVMRRRETHLLSLEDPSGEEWSSLLARFGAFAPAAASAGASSI